MSDFESHAYDSESAIAIIAAKLQEEVRAANAAELQNDSPLEAEHVSEPKRNDDAALTDTDDESNPAPRPKTPDMAALLPLGLSIPLNIKGEWHANYVPIKPCTGRRTGKEDFAGTSFEPSTVSQSLPWKEEAVCEMSAVSLPAIISACQPQSPTTTLLGSANAPVGAGLPAAQNSAPQCLHSFNPTVDQDTTIQPAHHGHWGNSFENQTTVAPSTWTYLSTIHPSQESALIDPLTLEYGVNVAPQHSPLLGYARNDRHVEHQPTGSFPYAFTPAQAHTYQARNTDACMDSASGCFASQNVYNTVQESGMVVEQSYSNLYYAGDPGCSQQQQSNLNNGAHHNQSYSGNTDYAGPSDHQIANWNGYPTTGPTTSLELPISFANHNGWTTTPSFTEPKDPASPLGFLDELREAEAAVSRKQTPAKRKLRSLKRNMGHQEQQAASVSSSDATLNRFFSPSAPSLGGTAWSLASPTSSAYTNPFSSYANTTSSSATYIRTSLSSSFLVIPKTEPRKTTVVPFAPTPKTDLQELWWGRSAECKIDEQKDPLRRQNISYVGCDKENTAIPHLVESDVWIRKMDEHFNFVKSTIGCSSLAAPVLRMSQRGCHEYRKSHKPYSQSTHFFSPATGNANADVLDSLMRRSQASRQRKLTAKTTALKKIGARLERLAIAHRLESGAVIEDDTPMKRPAQATVDVVPRNTQMGVVEVDTSRIVSTGYLIPALHELDVDGFMERENFLSNLSDGEDYCLEDA